MQGNTTSPVSIAPGDSLDAHVDGTFALSGIGTPRTGKLELSGTITVSYETVNECGASPCYLEIVVDGSTYPSAQDWGDGIVSLRSSTPQPPMNGFEPGSWAAQFNDDPGCYDGYDAVNVCHSAGTWSNPETVTVTEHAVPKGGFGGDSPPWASRFVKWGGDCASAGESPSCTLHIGTQRSTAGGYSLSVTAYFQQTPNSSSR